MTDIATYRKKVDLMLLDFHDAQIALSAAHEELAAAKLDAKAIARAQNVAQLIAQQIQQQIHDRIAALVTRCLQAVFDDSHEFQIVMERRRGKTEAHLVFLVDGEPVDKRAQSGGVLDVAAFALRLASMSLLAGQCRPLLILDEPFKNVHGDEYRSRVCTLLNSLSEEMGIQLILVTGIDDLKTGKVIELA